MGTCKHKRLRMANGRIRDRMLNLAKEAQIRTFLTMYLSVKMYLQIMILIFCPIIV